MHNQITTLGSELVFSLRGLEMNTVEAEELLYKLTLIAGVIADHQKQGEE